MISLLLLCLLASPRPSLAMEPHEVAAALEEALDSVHAKIDTTKAHMQSQLEGYKSVISDLARQTMLMQFNMEERVRSDGDSGVKILRGMSKGPENFYETGVIANGFNQIHDHSNYNNTVGMGEVIAVLNGVEFRTRHNDYKLKRPSTTSTAYHATEDLKLPDVPLEVTLLPTVDAQIIEMREWFKAFKTQNSTHRDYTKYFKPVMCYLEGAWVIDTGKDSAIDEPFDSDRHQIDASSWFDLQEKVRFASYTGSKSRLENFAYLPTTIMAVNETSGLPSYAQWNYRILCSDLKEDIPTKELRLMDDLAFRVPRQKSKVDMKYSRGARFRLYEEDKDKFTKYSKLDRLFYTIPGKDNIPAANMTQESFGTETMLDMAYDTTQVPLNTGYYHRFFKYNKNGAMGLASVARGYNDACLFVAQTTQERVAPAGLDKCDWKKVMINGKERTRKVCKKVYNRFTYAIPLEIIYLTPLQKWNPYNIETGKKDAVVTGDRTRNGAPQLDKAYNGTAHNRHYLTPVEFFSGSVDRSDPADTVRNSVGVLDRAGNIRKTTASGVKVVLQNIEGVGKVRLRYPIAPIHGEGAPVFKELNALKRSISDRSGAVTTGIPATVSFTMSTTFKDPPGVHDHELQMPWEDFKRMLNNNEEVWVTSDSAFDHTHNILVRYNKTKKTFQYLQCDTKRRNQICWDGHPKGVTLSSENEAVQIAILEGMVI